jgi:hypothetical protein
VKRNFRASKGTSIIPFGNNLVIGGLDVASLAAAAVKLSGFAPTFSNSYVMDQLGTRTAHASKFYSGNMGGDGCVKNHVEVVNVDQFIDFCHFDIYRILQCGNSSSSSGSSSIKYRNQEEQNRAIEIGVLPNTVSDTLLSTQDDVLKQYDRLLYLETSQGVLVYFPDLKRKETHRNQSMNSNKRRNENVLEEKSDRSNKNSWRTRGNGEKKEKKGREKERRGKGKGSVEGSGNDNSGDNSGDDVGNWRDNDSESDEDSDGDSVEDSEDEGDEDDDEEAGEDTDTPNFRNSLSPTITHSKTGSSSIADRHIPKQDNNSKTKKKSSGERRGPSAVRPVQGSVWKLLAPSSDDVAVGEILDGVV